MNKKDYEGIKMIPEDCSDIRFALLKEGKRILYVFGVNPSTATDTYSDRTMTKVINYIKDKYDGFVMMNLYPLRSTDPSALPKNMDKELHQKNLEHIWEIMGNTKNPEVLMAFGDSIGKTPYLMKCLDDIIKMLQPLNPQWKQIGNPTKLGNPRHPSRTAYSLDILDFDMFNYIKRHKRHH